MQVERLGAPAAQPPEGSPAPHPARLLAAGQSAAVFGALVVLGMWVTAGFGGRDPWREFVGLLAVLPALLLVRPWRYGPRWLAWPVLAPAGAAVLVAAIAPTGWSGAGQPAGWAYGGLLGWTAYGYVAADRHAGRRLGLAVAGCLMALLQFAQAWLPWWGSQDAAHRMVGTFYWHNQFAAYLVGLGLLAGGLALAGPGRSRLLGAGTVAVAFTGVLLSTSRASLALLVAGWLALPVLLRGTAPVRVLARRWALTGVAGAALAALLTSPLLMARPGGPWAALQARQAAQPVVGNGIARLDFWRSALDIFGAHPLTGAGFGSFGPASLAYGSPTAGRSTYVHNGLLQAFSDGGLLLGVAVLAALAVLAGALLRLARDRSWRGGGEAWLVGGGLLAVAALTAHSLVDFDWAYPSLLALFGLVGGLTASAGRLTGRADRPRSAARRPVPAVAAVAVLVVSAGLLARYDAVQPRFLPAQVPGLYDPRIDRQALVDFVDGTGTVGRARASAAVAGTARAATVDPGLQVLRAQALVRLGRTADGLALATATWRGLRANGIAVLRPVLATYALAGQVSLPADLAAAAREVR